MPTSGSNARRLTIGQAHMPFKGIHSTNIQINQDSQQNSDGNNYQSLTNLNNADDGEIKTLLEEAINQGKAFELLGKSMRIITRKQTKQIKIIIKIRIQSIVFH
jgi:hypothetical protein